MNQDNKIDGFDTNDPEQMATLMFFNMIIKSFEAGNRVFTIDFEKKGTTEMRHIKVTFEEVTE